MSPDPGIAQQYLSILLCWGCHRWRIRRITYADARQNVWLAWCEHGCPVAYSKDVLRRAAALITAQARRMSRETIWADVERSANRTQQQDPRLWAILHHYERHTASETIAAFGLPDTKAVRRYLGECVRKPERRSGKVFGEQWQRVVVDCTAEALRARGVPKATAWRAVQRGYYWQKKGADPRTGPKAFAPRR